MKVLHIEDSPEIVNTVSLCFRVRWPETEVISADEGGKGLKLAESERPDIIILDINLPDMDGFEVLKSIRLFSDVPIIILSVRDSEMDRVKGLEMGADDYIIKPFSGLDLIARVKATLRRTGFYFFDNERVAPFVLEELSIDFSTRSVTLSGQPLHLTPIEFRLLYSLVRNAGRVVPKQSLANQVWGGAEYIAPSTMKKLIHQLRTKLGDTSAEPRFIHNERGIGYRFERP